MSRMNAIPTSQLAKTLQIHIDTLTREAMLVYKTNDSKHMKSAEEQLRQFIDANFIAKGVE